MKKSLMFSIGIIILAGLLGYQVFISGCSTTSSVSSSAETTTTVYTGSPTTTTLLGTAANYYPSSDGLSWTYESRFVDSTNPLNSYHITEKHTFRGSTNEVGTLTQIKQVENYRLDSTTLLSSRESMEKISSTNVEYYGTKGAPTLPPLVILQFPLAVGNSWSVYSTVQGVVSAAETITVPAGTYPCYRVDFKTGEIVLSSFWYAGGVGLVKSERKALIGGSITAVGTQELTSINF
ncbi:MAG: hypothetical protein ABIH69_02490 [bacterium]